MRDRFFTIVLALVLAMFVLPSCGRCDAPVAYVVFTHLRKYNSKDKEHLPYMWDMLHTTATLQGIVNRKSPHIYIDYVVANKQEVDRFWWNYYREEGRWLSGRDTVVYNDVVKLVEDYKSHIKGAVVYDSNVASTSCVASAVAGIENLIAVRYDTSPNSLYSRLILGGPKLKVKVWLLNEDGTSMFTGKGTIPQTNRESTGSPKNDAYAWFIDNYMAKNRCSGEYAGYYLDQYWRDHAG